MRKKRLTDPSQVPSRMSEKEEAEFWSTHEVTKEFLDKAERATDEELPPRTRSISVRFDEDVLQRLKALAESRKKGYQTLLKEFVIERLYEEEKRQQRPYLVTDTTITDTVASIIAAMGVTVETARAPRPAPTEQQQISLGETQIKVNLDRSCFDLPHTNVIGHHQGMVFLNEMVTGSSQIPRSRSIPEQNQIVAHGSD